MDWGIAPQVVLFKAVHHPIFHHRIVHQRARLEPKLTYFYSFQAYANTYVLINYVIIIFCILQF